MFVLNDVTKDARVLKEAATLSGAGHEVVVMGMLPRDSSLPVCERHRDGFEIRRIAAPAGREWWRPPPNPGWVIRRRLRRRADRVAGRVRRLRTRAKRWARRSARMAARLGGLGLRVLRAVAAVAQRSIGSDPAWLVAGPSGVGRAGIGSGTVIRWPRRGPWGRLRRRLRYWRDRWRREGIAFAPHALLAATRQGRRLPRAFGRSVLLRAHRRLEGASAGATMPREWAGPVRSLGRRMRWAVRWALGTFIALAGFGAFVVVSALYATGNRMTGDALDWALRVRYRWGGWARAAAAEAPLADIWHGHDLSGLMAALAGQVRNGAPIIYDSHELILESSTFALRPRWALAWLARIERSGARQAAAVVTVNGLIAQELQRRLKPRRTVVVRNCPRARLAAVSPVRDRLRAAGGVPSGAPVAVYHGGLLAHRGIEEFAEALLRPGLEEVHGILLGYGSRREALVELAAEPRFQGRLHVLDPVPPEELVDWLATASVAVMPIQPSTLNHRLSTPNKLFEALAAGVPIVGPDFRGFREIVLADPDRPLGLLCDPRDVDAIAGAIHAIVSLPPAAAAQLRARCRVVTQRRWTWEQESSALLRLYGEILLDAAGTTGNDRQADSGHPPERTRDRDSGAPQEREAAAA